MTTRKTESDAEARGVAKERARVARLLRREIEQAKGFAWYHPQFNLESILRRVEKRKRK